MRTVNVSASLAGRPVAVVRRDLQALGLVAEVRAQPDGQAAPGTVLRLYPTGQVRAGTVILLTTATPPPGASARGVPGTGGAAGGGHVPPGGAEAAGTFPPAAPSTAKVPHQATPDQSLITPGRHWFTR